MNLGDIMAFVALAETGSINRAALRLGLTQPATSRRVQNFEASLGGAQLLDRSVKPPVLTPAGRQALAHCQRVLKAVAELEAGAADSREPAGDLRIGVSPGLAEAVLSAPLDDLRNRYPDLQLRISTQWTTPLIHAVRDSELDCAIALVTEDHTLPAGVVSVVLGSEPLAVVAPRDAHFTNRKNRRALCLGDLSQYGWVLNPAGCGYREALVRAMDRAQAPFRLVAEVLGYDLQLSLIAKGAGIGLVPARLIDKNRKRGQLDVLNVTDFSLEVQVAMLRGAWLGSLGVAVDYLQSRFTAVRYKKSA